MVGRTADPWSHSGCRVTRCHAWRIASVAREVSSHNYIANSLARHLLWLATKSRMRTVVAWAFIGALIVTNPACEHNECDDAVRICRANFGKRTQAPPTQMLGMGGLKTTLARLHAKVPWPTETARDPSVGAGSKIEAGQLEKKHSEAAQQPARACST